MFSQLGKIADVWNAVSVDEDQRVELFIRIQEFCFLFCRDWDIDSGKLFIFFIDLVFSFIDLSNKYLKSILFIILIVSRSPTKPLSKHILKSLSYLHFITIAIDGEKYGDYKDVVDGCCKSIGNIEFKELWDLWHYGISDFVLVYFFIRWQE